MTYLILFLEFFKIGAITFGGGYAMIPLIMQTVADHKWMSTKDLVNFIAISESTPGTFAVNISTYVGSKVGGLFGSIISIVGMVLPCFIVICIIATIYEKYKENKITRGILFGLNSTVVGLIAATVISVGKEIIFRNGISLSVFSDTGFYVTIGIFIIAAVLVLVKKINPIYVIIGSGVVGIICGYAGLIPI